MYRYGASVWLFVTSFIFMAFLAIFVYLPVFFKLQITNIYEYLERRFDRRTRILAFVLYVLSDILMFPILAYPPALTFATGDVTPIELCKNDVIVLASGINSTLCAFILCSICLFYTSIGGLKTVVWTDFVQFGVIMVTLVTIFAIGVNGSDGFVSVWNTASAGGRLEVFKYLIVLFLIVDSQTDIVALILTSQLEMAFGDTL